MVVIVAVTIIHAPAAFLMKAAFFGVNGFEGERPHVVEWYNGGGSGIQSEFPETEYIIALHVGGVKSADKCAHHALGIHLHGQAREQ